MVIIVSFPIEMSKYRGEPLADTSTISTIVSQTLTFICLAQETHFDKKEAKPVAFC